MLSLTDRNLRLGDRFDRVAVHFVREEAEDNYLAIIALNIRGRAATRWVRQNRP